MTPCSHLLTLPIDSTKLPTRCPTQPSHVCGCRLLVVDALHGLPKSLKNLQDPPGQAPACALTTQTYAMHTSPLLWSHRSVCRNALCRCARHRAFS